LLGLEDDSHGDEEREGTGEEGVKRAVISWKKFSSSSQREVSR